MKAFEFIAKERRFICSHCKVSLPCSLLLGEFRGSPGRRNLFWNRKDWFLLHFLFLVQGIHAWPIHTGKEQSWVLVRGSPLPALVLFCAKQGRGVIVWPLTFYRHGWGSVNCGLGLASMLLGSWGKLALLLFRVTNRTGRHHCNAELAVGGSTDPIRGPHVAL